MLVLFSIKRAVFSCLWNLTIKLNSFHKQENTAQKTGFSGSGIYKISIIHVMCMGWGNPNFICSDSRLFSPTKLSILNFCCLMVMVSIISYFHCLIILLDAQVKVFIRGSVSSFWVSFINNNVSQIPKSLGENIVFLKITLFSTLSLQQVVKSSDFQLFFC